ncbi:MAG: hypothetical protein ACI9TH_001395 [Kiritimatiellia bacterium]|jgi:uncharacterized protein (TIGR02421 family)
MHRTSADEKYRATIKSLSDRLVNAQRPVRILDAIKWDDEVKREFLAAKGDRLPQVDASYYAGRPLGFDPAEKLREFREIEADVILELGRLSSVGDVLRRMCREYSDVVRMLEARGQPAFAELSRELYGSTGEAFHAGESTLADFGRTISRALNRIDKSLILEADEKNITAPEAVEILGERLKKSFGDSSEGVRVIIDDGIVADAAAGSDYIKLRQDAMFSDRELRMLEVHEGWVHVGTTINGAQQSVCTFLSKGPPSSTVTQEGLAVLMEVFAFVTHPARLRRLVNRIRAVHLAEEGADFMEVYRFYLEQEFSPEESYISAMRVFRGSVPDGQPFTKDISYTKGFILVYNFIRFAVKNGKLEMVPLLFCGKTVIEDMRVLKHLLDEEILDRPRFVPPQFADLHALTSWMCYADFLHGFNSSRLEADYASFF